MPDMRREAGLPRRGSRGKTPRGRRRYRRIGWMKVRLVAVTANSPKL